MNNTVIIINAIAETCGSILKLCWYSFFLFCIILSWCLESYKSAISMTLIFMVIAYFTPRLFTLWCKLVEKL